jgi:hypothetical protein
MSKRSEKKYNEEKNKELWDRVGKELKSYEGKTFLEQYGLYMLRVQMYELYLKRDLIELFEVPEEKAERMNLASILRYYEKNDIRAHPILYVNLTEISQQRNSMAHEFLALAGTMSNIAGEAGMHFFHKDLNRWAMDLELAFQQYLMLKETDMLYKDWGVKPTFPYPKYDIPDEYK